MKRVGRLTISVILVIFSTSVYILMANWDYFVNSDYGFTPVDINQIELINWDEDGERYVSREDPQIVFQRATGYTRVVDIYCSVDASQLDPVVFFIPHGESIYLAENSFVPNYQYNGTVLSIEIEQDVQQFRIDLTNNAGFLLGLEQIRISSLNFNVGVLGLLLVWLIVGILLLPLYFTRGTGKNLRRHWEDFKRYRFLLWNLVKKDITTKYRRSVLGILWSVLNPLLMMMVITAVFQHLFRFSVENFPLYYLTGFLIFNFVSEATTSSMNSVLGSAALIKKVYIPKYIFPLEKCIFALINTLFSMIAVVIIFFILRVVPPWTIIAFPISLLYTFVFSVGLGMILATLEVFFRDTGHLYGVWITAWMYLTPIIYPMDILPKAMETIVRMNPLYYYVEYFRYVVLYGEIPGLWLNAVCALFALGFLGVGVIFFKKAQDRFILHM
jgi:ABC-2 type transport system permease protein